MIHIFSEHQYHIFKIIQTNRNMYQITKGAQHIPKNSITYWPVLYQYGRSIVQGLLSLCKQFQRPRLPYFLICPNADLRSIETFQLRWRTCLSPFSKQTHRLTNLSESPRNNSAITVHGIDAWLTMPRVPLEYAM